MLADAPCCPFAAIETPLLPYCPHASVRRPRVALPGPRAPVCPPGPAALHRFAQLRLWYYHHHADHCEGALINCQAWAVANVCGASAPAYGWRGVCSPACLFALNLPNLSSSASAVPRAATKVPASHLAFPMRAPQLPFSCLPATQAGPKITVPAAAAARLFAGGKRLALVARNERPQVWW